MKNKGFTLIEILIALVIFAFSMATIYWGFSQSMRTSKRAIEELNGMYKIKNFFLLNREYIKTMEEGTEIKDNFKVIKKHINVTVNDNFNVEDENFYLIKIKDLNSNYEFTFYESK